MNISLCKHKSGQMLQAVKQLLTWMPESFDARFPVSVNSFIVIGVPTFVLRPLKIQMFGGQTFLFEPTLTLFSRYVSTVGSKRRVSQLAGVRGCRRKRKLSCFAIGCWLFIYWGSEDLNDKQFSPSRNRLLRRTPTSQDRCALRLLLWPDYSTYKSFDSSPKVIPSLRVISLAVRDRQWNELPAKFKITWRHSNRWIRWRP